MSAGPPSGRAHGLAPRAWLIWSLAAVTIALSTDNPVYRGLVALAALDSSGGSAALQPQILDSGHEAAPVQVAVLPSRFLITATGPSGAQLRAQLQIDQSS